MIVYTDIYIYILGDAPALGACQPLLGLRPHSRTTITLYKLLFYIVKGEKVTWQPVNYYYCLRRSKQHFENVQISQNTFERTRESRGCWLVDCLLQNEVAHLSSSCCSSSLGLVLPLTHCYGSFRHLNREYIRSTSSIMNYCCTKLEAQYGVYL